jgi:hypothetical protein
LVYTAKCEQINTLEAVLMLLNGDRLFFWHSLRMSILRIFNGNGHSLIENVFFFILYTLYASEMHKQFSIIICFKKLPNYSLNQNILFFKNLIIIFIFLLTFINF